MVDTGQNSSINSEDRKYRKKKKGGQAGHEKHGGRNTLNNQASRAEWAAKRGGPKNTGSGKKKIRVGEVLNVPAVLEMHSVKQGPSREPVATVPKQTPSSRSTKNKDRKKKIEKSG